MNIGVAFPQVEIGTVGLGLTSPGDHVKALEQFK